MIDFDDIHPSSGSEIELSLESELLFDEFRGNLQRLINSEAALTFQTSDKIDSTPGYTVETAAHLGRVVFMKLEGLEGEETPTEKPSLQLAVLLNGHGRDASNIEEFNPSEPLQWADGIQLKVVDRLHNNLWGWNIGWSPHCNSASIYGGKSGFVEKVPSDKNNDILMHTYGVSTGMDTGASITEDHMSAYEELELINAIIHDGQFDAESEKAFITQLDARGGELLMENMDVMRDSMSYFDKIISTSLSSADVRDMLAWQQYWHDQR